MAVGGRMLRDSISFSSDEIYDFPCSPCSKDGKTVSGMIHCIDCDENLCASCLKHHNKFAAMRGHQILDKVQIPQGQRCQLPNQRCMKHGGKLIEVYCPGHDSVGCSVCITIEHSSCRGIKFIPDIAKGISTSKDVLHLEAEISDLQSRFKSLKQKTDADLTTLNEDKSRIQEEIRALRKKINDHLDEMEEKLLNDIDSKYNDNMQNLDSRGSIIDHTLAALDSSRQKLEAVINNDSEVFVMLKSDFANLKKNIDIADQMERSGNTSRMKLKEDRNLQKFLSDFSAIGEVKESFIPLSASFNGEYNVRCKEDKNVCDLIHGICITAQGSIILTDFRNKRLKKFDGDYNLRSHIDLPDGPFGVCQIDDSQLAITILDQKKVQFVSNTESMDLLSSFGVRDCCRGIQHNKGLLYICCGGSKRRDVEGPGHLAVYNIEGGLLRTYFESLEQPYDLAISGNGKEVYVVDEYRGLIVIDSEGRVVSEHQDNDLNSAGGLCKLYDDKLCVAGRRSNTVVVMTDDGQVQQKLLTETDGIKLCHTLCFDKKKSRLIVSLYQTEKIHVFQLNT